jgi:hypothetical protein
MGSQTQLECVTEGLFVAEIPRVSIFLVPVVLKLLHALHDAIDLVISHQAYKRCSGLGDH